MTSNDNFRRKKEIGIGALEIWIFFGLIQIRYKPRGDLAVIRGNECGLDKILSTLLSCLVMSYSRMLFIMENLIIMSMT